MKYVKGILITILTLASTSYAQSITHDEIINITNPLLNKPYKNNPTGEGTTIWPYKPKINLHAFDCLTFVETALYILQTKKQHRWYKTKNHLIDSIRYHQTPANYQNRNHFMELHGIHSWHKNHLSKDITPSISLHNKPLYTISTTQINLKDWINQQRKTLLKNIQDKQVSQEMTLWHQKSENNIPVNLTTIAVSDIMEKNTIKQEIKDQITKPTIIFFSHKRANLKKSLARTCFYHILVYYINTIINLY